MNILMKTFVLLLFIAGCTSPLSAQKKLALANECFNAKAYYLASRYYQDFFEKQSGDCHPDQLKLAQSFAATQQLQRAETTFEAYMNCGSLKATDHIVYGKFLIDIKAYERAIPHFERAMNTEPQLARHYLLVCQTAMPKQLAPASTVFTKNEPITSSAVAAKEELPSQEHLQVHLLETSANSTNAPILTASVSSTEIKEDLSTNNIKSYASAITQSETNLESFSKPIPDSSLNLKTETTSKKVMVNTSTVLDKEKKFSRYGVRLGTYKPSSLPDLSSIAGYGRIEKKKWNGKIIFFLVDFPDREAAEDIVKLAVEKKFRSAILVEKLASGRMKSVR